jgi:hypothetical protein
MYLLNLLYNIKKAVMLKPVLFSILISIITASAYSQGLEDKYFNLKSFIDRTNKNVAYRACDHYKGSKINYTASGEIYVALEEETYQFPLEDITLEAASIWNSALKDVSCWGGIHKADVDNPSNFIINDKYPEKYNKYGTIAATVTADLRPIKSYPSGYPSDAGIYWSKNPINGDFLKHCYGPGERDCIAGGNKNIAYSIVLLVAVHEFGHALGLAHSFQENDSDYENSLIRTINNGTDVVKGRTELSRLYNYPPIMVPEPAEYFYAYDVLNYGAFNADHDKIGIALAYVNHLKSVHECGNNKGELYINRQSIGECELYLETIRNVLVDNAILTSLR